jgi:ribonuclease P protein component
VDRNRLKRRLRELARLDLLPVARGAAPADIAIRARRDAYDASFEALRGDIQTIAGQAGRIAGGPSGATDETNS